MLQRIAVFLLSLLPCLLSLLCCPPAMADAAPHWLEVKSEHFTVITDAGDGQARRVTAQLEHMHALFAKLLPGAHEDPGSRIVVLAFKNRKGLQAVEPPAYLGKNLLDLAGLFLTQPNKSFILLRLDTEGQHPYEIVYHEYTHYMVRHVTRLPVWLNEGLAEFYQNTDLDGQTARTGQPNSNDLYLLRQQRLIPLPTLFAVDHTSPYYHEETRGNIFYAESWALTHYLMIGDRTLKTDRLREYASRVVKGEDAVSAAQHTFGDLKVLEKKLNDYVNQGSYMAFAMPLQDAVQQAGFQIQPLSSAEVDALRAQVLIDDGRQAEGKALIEAVLKDAPGNPDAHESMGLLELRDGHMREARKWFGEAVSLHSGSYLAYYYFGALSLQFGGGAADSPTEESVSASLHQALTLNPSFAPTADALARFDSGHGKLDEAVPMAAQAVQFDPTNIDYRMNAAQIRVQLQQWSNAVDILKAADTVAQTPEEHERVRARLTSLERYQAQLAESHTAASANATPSSDGSRAGFATGPAGSSSAEPRPTEIKDLEGHVLHPTVPVTAARNLPPGPPNGPKHTVKGVLQKVGCLYPKGLQLDVTRDDKVVPLYSNDMYGIQFTAANFTPTKELNPCTDFEGMKASVVYAEMRYPETEDKGDKGKTPAVAGQIVAIELSK